MVFVAPKSRQPQALSAFRFVSEVNTSVAPGVPNDVPFDRKRFGVSPKLEPGKPSTYVRPTAKVERAPTPTTIAASAAHSKKKTRPERLLGPLVLQRHIGTTL